MISKISNRLRYLEISHPFTCHAISHNWGTYKVICPFDFWVIDDTEKDVHLAAESVISGKWYIT